MESLGNVAVWLRSQPPLSFLLVGFALYSSAVGLVLLWQSVSEGLPVPSLHAPRWAAGRALLKGLARTLGG